MSERRRFTASDIGRMSLADYEQNRDEIHAALADGRVARDRPPYKGSGTHGPQLSRKPTPAADKRLGSELPPVHPNCRCVVLGS